MKSLGYCRNCNSIRPMEPLHVCDRCKEPLENVTWGELIDFLTIGLVPEVKEQTNEHPRHDPAAVS